MKKVIALVIFTIIGIDGVACLNEYRTLITGENTVSDYPSTAPRGHSLDKKKLKKELAELDGLYRRDSSVETLSDYGVVLVYLGNYQQAIDVFRRIEQRTPDLYATAANIGTAFELLGDVDSALFYIKKAITLDSNSHEGSEWIHVRILEAKKILRENPGYLENNSVLGMDFGTDPIPSRVQDSATMVALIDQLRYQLEERMTFVNPQDPVVAQLLFDLGNLSAVVVDLETALECYKGAKEYGYAANIIHDRIEYMTTLTLVNAEKHVSRLTDGKMVWYLIAFLFGGGIIGLTASMIVRLRRKKV